MEHQLPGRLDFLSGLVEAIEDLRKGPVYFAPRLWPNPEDYPPPKEAFDIVATALEKAPFFILYYPDKVPSGALVELGMAIAMGKKVIIHTEDLSNITYFLRRRSLGSPSPPTGETSGPGYAKT